MELENLLPKSPDEMSEEELLFSITKLRQRNSLSPAVAKKKTKVSKGNPFVEALKIGAGEGKSSVDILGMLDDISFTPKEKINVDDLLKGL